MEVCGIYHEGRWLNREEALNQKFWSRREGPREGAYLKRGLDRAMYGMFCERLVVLMLYGLVYVCTLSMFLSLVAV